MRKIASMTVMALMTLVLLTPSFSRKKIEVWCTDKEVAGLEPVARQFRRTNKVEVDIVVQAEVRSKYMQAAIAKTGPDIVVGAHDWVGQLAKNGVIAEVNLSDKDKNKYFPVSIDGFTYNGRLYGVPYCVESLVLFYNKKLIKTPPSTWEEVLSVAKGMTKDGKYGFLYGIDNNFYNNFPIIGSQGGYIFKWVNGKYDILDVGLDTPGAIDANKFIYRFVQEGVVPASTNNGIVISNFKEGKVAMIMDGPWNTLDFVNSMGADVVGATKLPTLKGKKSVPFVGARGFMINSASRYQAEAREFIIKFAGEKDGQIAMYRAGGRPPAHLEACDVAMKENEFIKTVVESVKDGISMPNVRAMSVVWNYAAGMIDKYKTGEQTVENAVKTAVSTIKQDLSGNPSRFE
ncbi:MAG: hypothetical protein A2015_00230 [Spirochaetes bacterium GWF1_31_7]|nr:MAG: hypothetical protein A2Y30_04280 [Spirochaetes bacterium GWE1_32_154]OHD45990.1 MAG: hypothetical protein A2Y29_07820 [Spirochaetes bacterium GWE2_31_10]OHD51017.1 MAG: hypothetical protein A2015_00230 [Spirochaetes bacterium GWF1_31_7]OHD83262.1 MAG: hypothetical protein A2355_15390 [Spirochaetes bacterium RIFOXYB1_FULL_32_8]HBD94332.1 hypothetical protein [Spirochaetia bacterium]